MDYLSKKWTIIILFELWKGDQEGKRFSEIETSMRNISPKILAERLKELEREGLVIKKVDTSSFPVKSEYKLTESGVDLVEALRQIKYWALKWKIQNDVCLNQDCCKCTF
jgi:DNA-binding HxlR family transcriptional regulator